MAFVALFFLKDFAELILKFAHRYWFTSVVDFDMGKKMLVRVFFMMTRRRSASDRCAHELEEWLDYGHGWSHEEHENKKCPKDFLIMAIITCYVRLDHESCEVKEEQGWSHVGYF